MRHTRMTWLVVTLLALTSCAPSVKIHPSPPSTRMPPTTAAPTATPPPLGQVPTKCPVTNADPQRRLSLAPVIGTTPVWATWLPGPSIFHGAPGEYVAPYGWAMTKAIWEVGPNYSDAVTVRGEDIFDHSPLLFQFEDTVTADAVLDPQHPGHPVSSVGADWREWGSAIMPPKAGCYMMQVSWATGHWDITFAFGA